MKDEGRGHRGEKRTGLRGDYKAVWIRSIVQIDERGGAMWCSKVNQGEMRKGKKFEQGVQTHHVAH